MKTRMLGLLLALVLLPAGAQTTPEEALSAVVGVRAKIGAKARSAETLGTQRSGSGALIREGVVLTIGYLVMEAEEIRVTAGDGRSVAATLAAFDAPSGLGVLKLMSPLGGKPIALGASERLVERERAVAVTAAARTEPTLVHVVSRRPFAGGWEYQLDSAIFTFPPVFEWSGAPLIGARGELLGIGSLVVGDAAGAGTQSPGNMFVPVDLVRAVIDPLLANGRRSGPARPWLGVNTDEVRGRLFVSRVSPEGPAARAGLKAGDLVLSVGGDEVTSLAEFYRKVWARGAAGVEVPLKVLQGAAIRDVKVRSIDRNDYFRSSTN
ncbi:MAG: S1C family serine protease [Betaproteobacteria bacterium]